jgi:hypothetical protein
LKSTKQSEVFTSFCFLFSSLSIFKVKATTDFFNEEQDSDDESGLDDEDDDDLDGLAAMDDEEVEEDELEGEEDDFDSFIAEDEELEDGLSVSDDSIASEHSPQFDKLIVYPSFRHNRLEHPRLHDRQGESELLGPDSRGGLQHCHQPIQAA